MTLEADAYKSNITNCAALPFSAAYNSCLIKQPNVPPHLTFAHDPNVRTLISQVHSIVNAALLEWQLKPTQPKVCTQYAAQKREYVVEIESVYIVIETGAQVKASRMNS